MRKLFIHIGAHKTASTLIQKLCKESRDSLRQDGIFYDPSVAVLAVHLMQAAPFADARIAEEREKYRGKYAGLAESTILASGEAFFGSPQKGYANIGAIAGNLREIFRDFDVSIIACVRRQDTFVESLYRQLIKQARVGDNTVETFSDFRNSYKIHAFRWDELLDRYAEVFGHDRVHVIPYEIIFSNENGLINRFFAAMGLYVDVPFEALPVLNPALSEKGLEILDRCYPILDDAERTLLRGFLEEYFAKPVTEGYGLFPDAERAEFLAHYRESNLALFERYMPQFDPSLYTDGADQKEAARG